MCGSEPLFADALDVITERLGSCVSFVGVAIKSDSQVIGTLSVHRVMDPERRYSFDGDLRLLTMIANLVGQTVKLHRMLSMDRQRLLSERASLEKALDARPYANSRRATPEVAGIIGESPAIVDVLETIAAVAKYNSTVLLRGESGTGKELFARAVHELSSRKHKPFVKVNCAALPESVLESELFGHERGAFTGALAQRAGRFELAHGGTLLLDEIGEISSAFQAKLLRVLQEGEFERVGGTRTLKVDVRLIFATNINLEEAVAKGVFRADLYYRISVVPVFLPPLRERPGDVALLAKNFLDQFNAENKRSQVFSNQRNRNFAALLLPRQCSGTGELRAQNRDPRARRKDRRQGFRLCVRQVSFRSPVDEQWQRGLPRPPCPLADLSEGSAARRGQGLPPRESAPPPRRPETSRTATVCRFDG